MHTRRFLTTFVLTSLLALASVVVVNLVVDPFAIFGSPAVEGFNAIKPGIASRARLFKTVNVVQGRWEALIVGTSRAEVGFDPGHAFFKGRRAFNAATGGQTYAESRLLVEAAARGGTLQQLLLVADFPVSNANVGEARDFEIENFAAWRRLTLAFSIDTLRQSVLTPLRQDRALVQEQIGLWTMDGRIVSPTPTDHRAHALESDRSYLLYHYFPAPHFAYAASSAARDPMGDIRRIVALAHDRGIELTVVIAPAHARQWQTVHAAGLWREWEQWKRSLVAVVGEEARTRGQPAFPLWDFSGYNAMTTEPFPPLGSGARMRWYWDSSHFNKHAGDIVLDWMAGRRAAGFEDLGRLLGSANLEPFLAHTSAGQRAWARQYPEDVAEIATIASQRKRPSDLRFVRSGP